MDDVGAGVADERVGTVTTAQLVLLIGADQRVIAGVAPQPRGRRGSGRVDDVVAAAAMRLDHVHLPGRRDEELDPGLGRVEVVRAGEGRRCLVVHEEVAVLGDPQLLRRIGAVEDRARALDVGVERSARGGGADEGGERDGGEDRRRASGFRHVVSSLFGDSPRRTVTVAAGIEGVPHPRPSLLGVD
jgi:hypothetical protein